MKYENYLCKLFSSIALCIRGFVLRFILIVNLVFFNVGVVIMMYWCNLLMFYLAIFFVRYYSII